MINNNKIKYWARNKILDAGFDETSFAWMNQTFDSSNADVWYQERYTVVNETINANESSVKTGLLYYDVIVNKGVGDDTQDDSAAALADLFEPWDNKEQVIDSTTKIDIDVATTGSPSNYETSRRQMPVRIEFRAYEFFDA